MGFTSISVVLPTKGGINVPVGTDTETLQKTVQNYLTSFRIPLPFQHTPTLYLTKAITSFSSANHGYHDGYLSFSWNQPNRIDRVQYNVDTGETHHQQDAIDLNWSPWNPTSISKFNAIELQPPSPFHNYMDITLHGVMEPVKLFTGDETTHPTAGAPDDETAGTGVPAYFTVATPHTSTMIKTDAHNPDAPEVGAIDTTAPFTVINSIGLTRDMGIPAIPFTFVDISKPSWNVDDFKTVYSLIHPNTLDLEFEY